MNAQPNSAVFVEDIGQVPYEQAWDYQAKHFHEILSIKSANRDRPSATQQLTDNYLIFCEHPHVFTLGKSGDESNLLVKMEELPAIHASYVHTNRGGDITYHGPGQIVVYPVIDLENFFTDIHRYMRTLEEAVIQTLQEFSISSGRIPGLTGVWLGVDTSNPRKICALGVKTSRWVTMHGLAFNVNTDLSYFDYIVPCGIADKAVTSLEKELGKSQDMTMVKRILKEKLLLLFEMKEAVMTR